MFPENPALDRAPDGAVSFDRTKVRRQAILLLLVFNLLTLAIGVVAAIDLRRLNTPEGTALRWVQAAVFGDCDDFLRYSVASPELPDPRVDRARCQDLREATADARNQSLSISLTSTGVEQDDKNTATATLVLIRQGTTFPVTIHLVRRDGDWRVLRDATTCASAGCG